MADESQYSTATDTTPPSSNKRKYDDQSAPPPSTRRQTGFSSPISDPAPPPSYNSVAPPADEIQMAKQKAQEIAARIMSGAGADIKRPKAENGASGFDSSENNKGFSSAPLGSISLDLSFLNNLFSSCSLCMCMHMYLWICALSSYLII